MQRPTASLFVALLAGALSSQNTYTSPPGLTNAYGNNNNAVPWGWPSPTSAQGEVLFQQIDDTLLGRVFVLKGFAFRHYYLQAVATWTYTVTVKLGDAATASSAMSTTFANNWKTGGGSTTVFNGQVSFPAVPAYARPPSPADAPLPFTTPHVYVGTDPLLWEAYIQSTSTTTVKQFHERGMTGSTILAGVLGAGCAITGSGSPMSSSGSISSTTLTDTLTLAPANTAAVLLLGDEADKLGGSIPLPIDLAIIGSVGCFLRVNSLASAQVQTTAAGGATYTLPYAMSPAISGSRLRTQWVALDSASVVRTSNGLDHCVPFATTGRLLPLNTIYASAFGTTLPVTGTNYVSGLVTVWTL